MQAVARPPQRRRAAPRAPRCRGGRAASAYAGYQIIRRNGAVVAFEPNKIAVALMKAFLAVHGTQGAASASVRETVDAADRDGGARAAALAPGRRHLPHRGRAGPRRARPDARRPPRGGARLRAVPRAAHAGARAPGHAGVGRRRPSCTSSTAASACRWTWPRCSALVESACAGLGADVQGRADPGRDAPQPVRRRADRRGLQGRHPGRAHADREGPGLHPRHRAAAAAHHPPRDPGRRGDAGADGRALRRVLPAVHQEGRAGRTARREAAAVRPGPPGRGAGGRAATCSSTTSACRRCTTATSCTSTSSASRCRRPSSCAWPWAWR